MKSHLIQSTILLALSLGLVSCAEVASDRSQAKINQEEATKAALAKIPNGIIKSSELEREHGKLVWSYDIATPGSENITEIQVDAETGAIVSNEVETPEDQAKEAAADKQ